MLTDAPVMITFSVNDFDAAKKFYGEVLGLQVDDSTPGMLSLHLVGGIDVWMYHKDDRVPAGYTLLNFTVDDLPKAMEELRGRGVKFELYDQPGTKTDENGIVDYGMMKIAFFNDPAGNNHAVMQMVPEGGTA
jgi:catechol 2,3-dioxygenase-like lactoylglutathione lyase family enzyme